MSLDHKHNHNWHVAINQATPDIAAHQTNGFMYLAKNMYSEVPRMIKLFAMERTGGLPALHQQCSKQAPEPIENNHLKCCLGVKCAECPQLLALEKTKDFTPEQVDEIKAWTCAAHIASKGGDIMGEGFILTVSDRMFWDNVYASLSYQDEDEVIA